MKTKEDVYQRILELNEIRVHVILKHSIYIPDVSFEFTNFFVHDPNNTVERTNLPSFRIYFYMNETYDDLCDRIDRFLEDRKKVLDEYATEDFKTILNSKNLGEYLRNKSKSNENN